MKWISESIPLFRVFGVPVQAHFTAVLYVAGFLAWSMCVGGSLEAVQTAGIILTILLGSLLLHEFAHAFVARLLKQKVHRILIFPFACATELETTPGGWLEIWIVVAGPAVNIALAAVGLATLHPGLAHRGLLTSVHMVWAAHTLRSIFCVFNILIAAINLIPCFPLDGGRLLRALLTLLIERISRLPAPRACLIASRVVIRYIALPIAVFSLAVCVHFHDWMDLVYVCLIPVVGHMELSEMEDQEDDECCEIEKLASNLETTGEISPLLLRGA